MKLAAWARVNGVHPQTAYRWFRQGTMPVPARRLPSGPAGRSAVRVGGRAGPWGGRGGHRGRLRHERPAATAAAAARRPDGHHDRGRAPRPAGALWRRVSGGGAWGARPQVGGGRRRGGHRRPGARHDRRAHQLLRPTIWAPWGAQPGAARCDLCEAVARSRRPHRDRRRAALMGPGQRFAIPDGWVARGFRFEVAATTPQQPAKIAQAFGARRFAYNWALEQVKANLDARAADGAVSPLPWNVYALRKRWNQAKHQVAPWWRAASKEAYASGIADLVAVVRGAPVGGASPVRKGLGGGRPCRVYWVGGISCVLLLGGGRD